jgi:hypothetical protein
MYGDKRKNANEIKENAIHKNFCGKKNAMFAFGVRATCRRFSSHRLVDDTCDRNVVKLEGKSPLRALVRRTVNEGKGVHREMESEESPILNAGLTNR